MSIPDAAGSRSEKHPATEVPTTRARGAADRGGRRRRVFVTAGLTASAAVLAMSVQASAQESAAGGASSYGDGPLVEPVEDEPQAPL